MSPLLSLILRRIGLGVLTIFAASIVIFVATEILPGDVATAILGQAATPDAVAAIRRDLNLDEPAVLRYFDWLGGVLQGDFGTSLAAGRPVGEMIAGRLGNTLFLAGTAAVVAVPLAVTLGLLAALHRDTWFDKTISMSTLAAISMPEFFIGYVLIFFIAIQLAWLAPLSLVTPNMGFLAKLEAIALPCATLVLVVTAHMMRMTRASIINVLSSPYIEMAALKGVPRGSIILRHALPNALSPIINVVVLNLAYLVVGVVVVEVVFVYPGIGQLMVDHVGKRDVPVVQACGLIFAVTYVGLNLLADVLSILANPRLRHPR